MAQRRRGAHGHRPRGAGRWPALPLARPAEPAHRIALARQAGRGARVRARQLDRPRRDRVAERRGGHRHLRQGALRPDGGAAPAGDHAVDAGRCRRAPVQGGPVVPDRDHARAGVRAWPEGDPRRRGEGADRRGAAARPVLQRAGRRAARHRRQARCAGPAVGVVARRAAAVSPDRNRRALDRAPLSQQPGAGRPPAARARLHAAGAAEQRRRCGQARAVLLRRLPAQHQHQGARGVARAGRHRLPLHGVVDVARDRRPDPDGRRGRRLGQPLDVHQGAARVPEPGRRHLLALGLPGDPPGGGVEGDPHLQDPVQRRGGDDRRPAGRRRDHGRPRRAPGRERGRQEGRGDQRRHRQVRPPARPVPGRHRVPPARSSSTRCSAGCARSKA